MSPVDGVCAGTEVASSQCRVSHLYWSNVLTSFSIVSPWMFLCAGAISKETSVTELPTYYM